MLTFDEIKQFKQEYKHCAWEYCTSQIEIIWCKLTDNKKYEFYKPSFFRCVEHAKIPDYLPEKVITENYYKWNEKEMFVYKIL